MVDPLTLSGVAWGISTAGWIISPIITKLVNKALTHIKPGKSKDELHDLLTHTLPRLALTLEAAEGSDEFKDLFEKMVKDLKSAFYDLEDMLDEVEYVLHEKQQLMTPKKNSSWISFASYHDYAGPSDKGVNIQPSRMISGSLNSMLKKKLKKIKDLVCEAQKTIELANLLPCHKGSSSKNKPTIVIPTHTPNPTTADPVEKVTGRDEDRLRIIKMLRDTEETEGEFFHASSSGGKCFSVIGICGIAGSGKTTLAQYVCESERIAGHFDLVMWIHVSQSFSVDTIYQEMFEEASETKCPKFNSLDVLRRRLENMIREKLFLLVLDDIWCNKDVGDQQLPQLLSPFKVGSRGSKVLVTSRNKDAVPDLGPNRYTTIPIPDLDENVFFELLMYYALGDYSRVDDQDQKELGVIGREIALKLRRSPLAARTVGGQLRRRRNVEAWRTVRDSNLLKETMGALVLSYQYLDERLKRCFAYLSIFPRRHYLSRDDLVNMWVAEGFIKTTTAEEEMEAVGQNCFDELVSTSFLQRLAHRYAYPPQYFVHDLLHDLAEKVAGIDCFRIENGWSGEVPRDVRHLFVEAVDGCAIVDKIVELEKLRTLIIRNETAKNNIVSEETFDKIFTKLSRLRVLEIRSITGLDLNISFPDSFGKLKHLRYLYFLNHGGLSITLPGTTAKLYNLQVLYFPVCKKLVLSSKKDMARLTNMRIHEPVPDFPNVGKMTSLQSLELFRVRKEEGYELHQLKNLNKIRRNLCIEGLEHVGSKEEALEAKLSDKERLRVVILAWDKNNSGSSRSLEDQANVLEGLCPPRFLEFLEIRNYQGLRSPNWTAAGNTNMNGENYLQSLWLNGCSRLGTATELLDYFVHLREIILRECNCDTLPSNIEQLKSLIVVRIQYCLNIRSLPALPQSLKRIEFWGCDEAFKTSCDTSGDPNWHRIKHIPSVSFDGRQMGTGIEETQSLNWKEYISL